MASFDYFDYVRCFISEAYFFLKYYRLQVGDTLRLTVYRQVFDLFIQEFKSYQSILSEIKTEYESALHRLEEQSGQLVPIKARLSTLKYEHFNELNKQSELNEELVEKFRYFCDSMF